MFEEKTYEALMAEKMNRIDSKLDKREGSMIHFAIGANSAETAQIYITLEWMFKQMFGDTADREYLKKIAYDTRGLVPNPATYAVLKGKFNIEVKEGTKLNLDDLNYIVGDLIEEADGFYYYECICDTLGEVGNRQFGQMIPVTYIQGLTTCELVELLVPGEEEEDTEAFRKRWRNSFNSSAFGGNRADYENKIKDIQGVGGCKCYRATDPEGNMVGGFVKCVVIASDYSTPSSELIDDIQTIVDPTVNQGEGYGTAPIGHIVTIEGVRSIIVNVSADITFADGYTMEEIRSTIEKSIDDYLLELRKSWEEKEDGIIVRKSQIEAAILDIQGIVDIDHTMINGIDANLQLGVDEIPIRGLVNG